MASQGTLWTYEDGSKTIRAVAALAGIAFDLPKGYVHYETNKTPEFTSKFPHGKIPGWEAKDGFLLFESAAIARYLAGLAPNSGLLGHSLKEAALIDQWVHLAETEVSSCIQLIAQLVRGALVPYSKPMHTTFTERAQRGLRTLEQHIATRTFFVGERLTLADVAVATALFQACSVAIDTATRATIPNLMRHMDTVVHQPAIAGIFGPVPVLEAPLAYVAPKKEKEAKETKEAKPKPAPAPKAEKKPKAKADDEDDEDEDAGHADPKVKNPLDDLPKSTFNLEDWKRAYSNKETRGPGGALEWFYEHFDSAGYSVWRVDFKYPEELTQTFMSSNQIGGFFARLEASRKYLFGSVGVLGVNNASLISGALILRGTASEPVVNVAPDWESYTFTPLDLGKTADKQFFEAALAWDLEIDGKQWADGKNFK